MHNTKAEKKPKNKVPNSGEKADFAGVAARIEHELTSRAPSSSSNAKDPRRRQARPEMVERGFHTQLESKDSLAREDHAPRSGEARNQYFRR
jgi:hypothetical protein